MKDMKIEFIPKNQIKSTQTEVNNEDLYGGIVLFLCIFMFVLLCFMR